MMKPISYPAPFRFFIPLVAAIGVFSFGIAPGKHAATPVHPPAKGYAVVELFTSEGCSSCPAADALVQKLQREGSQQVYILSFHVDYWNRLGWTDSFSQAAFSNRQRQYARRFALESIYTPQIVVNGRDQFTGSDEPRLRAAISKATPVSDLQIKAERSGTVIHFTYAASGKDALLNIALLQPEAVTQVKKGENAGRQLQHVNIVRGLTTIPAASSGMLDLPVPEPLRGKPMVVLAYQQQTQNLLVTGAAQVKID